MPEETGDAKKVGAGILKLIGVVAAVVSLTLGIREIVTLLKESAARKSKAAELCMEARGLASSGAYSQALQFVSQAAELAPEYRYVQVEISLAWLRNARLSSVGGESSFGEIVQKLLPVLYREIDTTRRVYSATILAHIGWADFLLFKEGDRSIDIDAQFKRALSLDSTNLYAHAMYGFWMLYPWHAGGSLDAANEQFAAALRGGEDTLYVRHLMIAAYRNASDLKYAAQTIKLANEMRMNHESLDLADRQNILAYAYFLYRDQIMGAVAKVLTPEEHLETFLYLADGADEELQPFIRDARMKLQKAVKS